MIAVYPSGASIPERLLRITVVFDQGRSAPGVESADLRDEGGRMIEEAFLHQDLRSPDGRALTLLLDPGRLKSGLLSRDQRGGALAAGRCVTLVLAGVPVKTWLVVAGGCDRQDPGRWRITPPASGTRKPLRVAMSGPMDFHARDLIAVADAAGRRVRGASGFAGGEVEWWFQPDQPWRQGAYFLRVHPAAETPCGDSVAEAFEQTAASREAASSGPTAPFCID